MVVQVTTVGEEAGVMEKLDPEAGKHEVVVNPELSLQELHSIDHMLVQ